MQLPKVVNHPGGFDVGEWLVEPKETGLGVFRIWFHHHLQANQFRTFARYAQMSASARPAFTIDELFQDKLDSKRFEIARVLSGRVRGRHLIVSFCL